MINTLLSQGMMNSNTTMAAALIIGFFFGLFLEKAGFGNSRRLAGIFYFRDMTVLKVMFSAVLTASIGFSILVGFKLISLESVYLLKTFYFAQISGGLLMGIGFVIGGWCPGTAAVGVSSGSIDALLFLVGAVGGSILYNELYPYLTELKSIGACGTHFAYEDLGISRALFVTLFTAIGICLFWGAELLEKKRCNKGKYYKTPFLKAYCFLLVAAAITLFVFESLDDNYIITQRLMKAQKEADHIGPMELAKRLVRGNDDMLLIDVRSKAEFDKFHIKGAVNFPLESLLDAKDKIRAYQTVVLYSNGAAHAVQGQMLLEKKVKAQILVLNGGLNAFIEECLKPLSLRDRPVDKDTAEKIQEYRSFFR